MSTITHEAAHAWGVTPIWLVRSGVWVVEGAAQFLTYLSERARTGSAASQAKRLVQPRQ